MAFKTSMPLALPRVQTMDFFRKPDTWFRLNPEWEVRRLANAHAFAEGAEFGLEVCYDRSGVEATYRGKTEEWKEGEGFSLLLDGDPQRRIRLTLAGEGETASALVYEELGEAPLEPRQQTERVLWLKSTADYLVIASRRKWRWRALRFLIDKLWLRLSPMGRRVVFLVLVLEFAGLLLLIGLLAIQRWL